MMIALNCTLFSHSSVVWKYLLFSNIKILLTPLMSCDWCLCSTDLAQSRKFSISNFPGTNSTWKTSWSTCLSARLWWASQPTIGKTSSFCREMTTLLQSNPLGASLRSRALPERAAVRVRKRTAVACDLGRVQKPNRTRHSGTIWNDGRLEFLTLLRETWAKIVLLDSVFRFITTLLRDNEKWSKFYWENENSDLILSDLRK